MRLAWSALAALLPALWACPDKSADDAGTGAGCDPAASETDCAVCLAEKCADLLAICQRNPDCACLARCLADDGVGGVPTCLAKLGLIARPPGSGALESCVAVACPDSDECATPSGWTPPAEVACAATGGAIGGGNAADCGFDLGLAFDANGSVLQLQSADRQICARIERHNDGSGALANTSWSLLDLRVGPLGQVAHIDPASAACWYSSHHNFKDWIHAWSGTRHYDLLLEQYGHGGERTYGLYVFEAGPVDTGACAASADGTTCLQGPIELFPVQ